MLNIGQNKKYCNLGNTKMESNNEFEKFVVKNPRRYYFDEINRIQSFDFDNILLDEKYMKIFMTFHTKL